MRHPQLRWEPGHLARPELLPTPHAARVSALHLAKLRTPLRHVHERTSARRRSACHRWIEISAVTSGAMEICSVEDHETPRRSVHRGSFLVGRMDTRGSSGIVTLLSFTMAT